VRETTISALSSLYEPYLREGFDAEHGGPYLWLDRAGYGEPAPEDVVLRPFRAVILVVGGQELYRRGVAVSPESPHTHQLPLPPDMPEEATVSIVFEDPGGLVIAQYEAEIPLQ